jgi:hypothetical protein
MFLSPPLWIRADPACYDLFHASGSPPLPASATRQLAASLFLVATDVPDSLSSCQ